jgi:predicted dehydrogenase
LNNIRIGILGAARIAPKAVIDPARGSPEFQIVAVAARDKERARIFASDHGIPVIAESYADIIGRGDVDLVYVALPTAGHMPWSIEAVKAGKAVLCEKPFAINAAQARAMVAASEATGRPLIEAFHYRYHVVMRRAVEVVASGELGALVDADALFDVPIPYRPGELRWTLSQGGGGALMDLGCYCVHALRTIAACEPRVAKASCVIERGVDASTSATLEFPSGLKAQLNTSMKSAGYVATLHVRGEKGSLDISNFLAPQMGCRFTVTIGGKTREEPTDGPSTYAAQLVHVADVMLRGAKPLTAGDDAIANMECIDAIYDKAGFERSSDHQR